MKFTIRTIKNRVLERLPFEMSPSHYEEILEVYFQFIKQNMESLDKLEVDNPLGTFHVKGITLRDKVGQFSVLYQELSDKRKKTIRKEMASLDGKHPNSYLDLSDEEIQIKIEEFREYFQSLSDQFDSIVKKKITRNGKRVNYKSKNKREQYQGLRPRKLPETPE